MTGSIGHFYSAKWIFPKTHTPFGKAACLQRWWSNNLHISNKKITTNFDFHYISACIAIVLICQYSPLSSLATTFDSPVIPSPNPSRTLNNRWNYCLPTQLRTTCIGATLTLCLRSCRHMPRTQPRSLKSEVCRQGNAIFHLQKRQPHAEQRWWNWCDPPLFNSAI